ncbi:MAG: rRNA pseudouridine synthase [Acidobacteria bacterium]|nr:rRNA pseudouridine synthase [Acidobacteriota bacterium]
MQVRLQKILSTAGISSRRASEAIIVEGRVTVNGQTVTELGSKADPDVDDIRVDGRRVKTATARRYILMYKPRGYITSRSDPEQRPTVIDLLTTGGVRDYVYPVGRLDYESEGLLLLTSDGELAERLMHPSHGVAREYHVRVRGVPARETLERLARGVALDGRKTGPAEVRIEKLIETSAGGDAILALVIYEGRNRQVRRMCDAVGHPVVKLKRVRIGPIHDEHIRPGEFRDLSEREITALKRAASRTTPKVRRSTSDVARGTPDDARGTSDVTRGTSHIPHRTSNVGRGTSNVPRRTSNPATPRPADSPRTERAPRPRAGRPTGRPRRG